MFSLGKEKCFTLQFAIGETDQSLPCRPRTSERSTYRAFTRNRSRRCHVSRAVWQRFRSSRRVMLYKSSEDSKPINFQLGCAKSSQSSVRVSALLRYKVSFISSHFAGYNDHRRWSSRRRSVYYSRSRKGMNKFEFKSLKNTEISVGPLSLKFSKSQS